MLLCISNESDAFISQPESLIEPESGVSSQSLSKVSWKKPPVNAPVPSRFQDAFGCTQFLKRPFPRGLGIRVGGCELCEGPRGITYSFCGLTDTSNMLVCILLLASLHFIDTFNKELCPESRRIEGSHLNLQSNNRLVKTRQF